VQQRLNLSRCRLVVTLVGQRSHVLDRVEILGNFGSCSANCKALGVSAAVYAAKVNNERARSILNNGTTARLLQPTAILQIGRCNITLYP